MTILQLPHYVNDKIVKGWNKLLRKAQSKWSKNPNDQECKETMLQIAEHTTDIRRAARGEYWNRFLEKKYPLLNL